MELLAEIVGYKADKRTNNDLSSTFLVSFLDSVPTICNYLNSAFW